MIVLSTTAINKAKEFAEMLTDKRLSLYHSRNINLTRAKLYDDIYRGKCGEIAAYNYLTENGYAISDVDFDLHENQSHDADLEIIGHGIQIHVKTCRKSFTSWLFEKNAPYVANPSAYDHNCLVKQLDYDHYSIVSIKHSADYEYKPTIQYMPSKVAIYL